MRYPWSLTGNNFFQADMYHLNWRMKGRTVVVDQPLPQRVPPPIALYPMVRFCRDGVHFHWPQQVPDAGFLFFLEPLAP